jgi:S1-C subfamily serine protease
MSRIFGLSLIVLATLAANPPAWGSSADPATGPLDGVQLFLSGSGTSPARGAQGYLGVDVRDVAQDQVGALKLKDPRGAEIVLVDHDAPAGKAGLREHDVVLQINGQAVDGSDNLRRMLHESPPGKTIVLVISRDGMQMTISAQMANREEVEREAWEQHLTVPEPPSPSADIVGNDVSPGTSSSAPAVHGGNSFLGSMLMNPSYTGAMLEKMSAQLAGYFGAPNGAGLLVRSVQPNSPAALAGMQAGDVVVRADTRTVMSTSDWAKAIKNSHGRPLTIVVLREKKEQTLTLTPDGKKRSSLDDLDPVVLARLGLSWLPRS